jgi:outer membrane protein assembly factor BamB
MVRQKAGSAPIYIGVGGHVAAVRPTTGEEIWRSKLKSSGSFVTIQVMGDHILAGAGGELFCLDARSGEIVWHNKLKGLGLGVIAFAGSDVSVMQAAAAAAAAATAAT